MLIVLSLGVALLGAAMYVLSSQPKTATLGLVMFGCGLLAFLLRFSGHFGLLAQ